MKIKSPDLKIPEDEPYHFDKLGRKQYGTSLFNLFKNIEDNNVVCLDAPWGEGKTTFIKMWLADLKKKDIECIYFDAYTNDYNEDPFITFVSEIMELLETYFKDVASIQSFKRDFKEKAVSIAKHVLVAGVKVGLRALTAGIINSSDIETIKEIKDDIPNETDKIISKYIESRIDSHKDIKQSRKEFQELLSQLGKGIIEKQKFPLLIIIDELDRCRPDFALLLLERIKHFFFADHVSFLIVTNLKQLENYVEKVYGDKIDSNNYLHKFFTITTTFPSRKGIPVNNFHKEFFKSVCEYHGIFDYKKINITATPLFIHLNLSLREIERVSSIITIFFANENNSTFEPIEIIPLVAILKVKFPPLFDQLRNGLLDYDTIDKSFMFESIPEQRNNYFNKEWFIKLSKYFFFTDEKLDEIRKTDIDIVNFEHVIPRNNRKSFLINIANKMSGFDVA